LNASFQEPATYVIEVRDTGIGIPKDAQERIFTRFFRVDRTHSRTSGDRKGGAGLGLAIAHWIAQAHQGTLTLVESSPSGSTFQIRLPRKAVEKQPESA
jgi:signal transduction histidine kinase